MSGLRTSVCVCVERAFHFLSLQIHVAGGVDARYTGLETISTGNNLTSGSPRNVISEAEDDR